MYDPGAHVLRPHILVEKVCLPTLHTNTQTHKHTHTHTQMKMRILCGFVVPFNNSNGLWHSRHTTLFGVFPTFQLSNASMLQCLRVPVSCSSGAALTDYYSIQSESWLTANAAP
jgi:hypothetical protein